MASRVQAEVEFYTALYEEAKKVSCTAGSTLIVQYFHSNAPYANDDLHDTSTAACTHTHTHMICTHGTDHTHR